MPSPRADLPKIRPDPVCYRFGTDHGARIRTWERAIAQCEGFAAAAMDWLSNPRLERVRPL